MTIARINGSYRHKKTARTYVVIAIGRNEATLEEVVVYKTPGTMDVHHVWVRPKAEFEEIMP